MPKAEWHDILDDPNSIHAPKKIDGKYSSEVTPEMHDRIRAWHNPPETVDLQGLQSWAKSLGFGTEKHSPVAKPGTSENVLTLTPERPSPNVTVARYMSTRGGVQSIRNVNPSNKIGQNEKSFFGTIEDIKDSAIRHGHVPSNVSNFIHTPKQKKLYTPQERNLHKQQIQSIFDTMQSIWGSKEQQPLDPWIKMRESLSPPALDLHNRLNSFMGSWSRATLHPAQLRKNEGSKVTDPHDEWTRSHIRSMIPRFEKTIRHFNNANNQYNEIIKTIKRHGIELSDDHVLYTGKKTLDTNFDAQQALQGKEKLINKELIHGRQLGMTPQEIFPAS